MARNDLFAAITVTSEAVKDAPQILTMAVADLERARLDRLDEVGEPPDDNYDLVLLAVPRGRGHTVSRNIVTGGFAHGDVLVDPPA